jgi:hypothetical protein
MVMTNPKPGKECPWCFSGNDIDRSNCVQCHGLGRFFAPGDALTAAEADALWDTHDVEVAYLYGPWGKFKNARPRELCSSFKFRLAPAAKEEKAEKRESVEAVIDRLWSAGFEDDIQWGDVKRHYEDKAQFRRGVLAILSLPASEIEAMKKESNQ